MVVLEKHQVQMVNQDCATANFCQLSSSFNDLFFLKRICNFLYYVHSIFPEHFVPRAKQTLNKQENLEQSFFSCSRRYRCKYVIANLNLIYDA